MGGRLHPICPPDLSAAESSPPPPRGRTGWASRRPCPAVDRAAPPGNLPPAQGFSSQPSAAAPDAEEPTRACSPVTVVCHVAATDEPTAPASSKPMATPVGGSCLWDSSRAEPRRAWRCEARRGHADRTTADPPRALAQGEEVEGARPHRLAAAAGRLHPRVHRDA